MFTCPALNPERKLNCIVIFSKTYTSFQLLHFILYASMLPISWIKNLNIL